MSTCPDMGGYEGPRPATPEELPAILETVNRVIRTLRGQPPTVGTDWPHIFCAENADRVIIVKDGDLVLSSASIWMNTITVGDVELNVGGINCVATLPEYRHQGLGSAVMRATHRTMADLGCDVGLLGTQIGAWYRDLGWEYAGCTNTYQLNRSNIRLLPELPPGVEVSSPPMEEVLPDMIRIRAQDRLGGVRSLATLPTVLRARGNPQAYVAADRSGTRAYLLCRNQSITEWGGDERLVAGLIRDVFWRSGDPTLSKSARDNNFKPLLRDDFNLVAPARGHALVAMLDTLRIPVTRSYAGMMRLLRPARMLEAYGCQGIGVTCEGDDTVCLTRGRQTVSMSYSEAVKLFFGPERVCDFADDVFPLPFWQWPIEHV